MREIRIEKLILDHFKCHDHVVLDLEGRNASIYGDNASGKTSLYDGLTWLLFGKDSRGSSTMEVMPLTLTGEVRDHLAVTQAEAVLRVDGVRRTFRRTYHELPSREGTVTGHTSEYYVDGVPCRKSQFGDKVRELVEEEVFQVLTTISRFAGDMSWQQRRRILCDLGKVAGDREIMAGRERFEPLLKALGQLSPEDLQKKLNLEKKNLLGVKSDIPPRISELQNTLLEIGDEDEESLRQRRAVLEQNLEEMKKDRVRGQTLRDALREKQLDLKDLDSANQAHRDSQQRDNPETQARQHLDQLKKTWQLLQGGQNTADRMERLRARIEIQEKRVFEGRHCPFCGQDLTGEALQKAVDAFEKDRQEKLDNLRDELKILEDREEKNRKDQENLREEYRLWSGILEKAKMDHKPVEDLPDYLTMRKSLTEEIGKLQTDITLDTQASLKKQEPLEKEMGDIDRHLSRVELQKFTRNRLSKLRLEEEAASEKLRNVEMLLGLLEEFGRYKVKFLENGINSRFRLARFRLFREQLNGGLEERCDVMVDGVPYGNLNSAARVNVGIDIIRTLSDHYGVRVPLFVDNAESVTRLEEGCGQVIRLVVSREDPVLRVERA